MAKRLAEKFRRETDLTHHEAVVCGLIEEQPNPGFLRSEHVPVLDLRERLQNRRAACNVLDERSRSGISSQQTWTMHLKQHRRDRGRTGTL